MSEKMALLSIAFSIILNTAGQLLLKKNAILRQEEKLFSLFFSPWMFCALACIGAASLAFTAALLALPLSLALPPTALLYILVPLCAKYLFHESVKPAFWLGPIFIVTGICLIELTV